MVTGWSAEDRALLQNYLPVDLVEALQRFAIAPAVIVTCYKRLSDVLARLLPFVPTPVVDLQLRQLRPDRMAGRALPGTIIRADLSGFTALSEQLATAGRQGSEEISLLINRLFTMLLHQIHATGGGIVQFGGDAITAFFDADRLGDQHAMFACQAALTMQQRMQDFATTPTSQGEFPLRLRIALHSGKLLIAAPGDDAQASLFITGRTLQEVSAAEDQAGPGEVLISDTTLHLLEAPQAYPKQHRLYLLTGLAPIASQVWLPPSLLPECPVAPDIADVRSLVEWIRLAQAYVPAAILRRFIIDSSIVGEFRPVTVFFASFQGLDGLISLLEPAPLVAEEPWSDIDIALIGHIATTYYMHLRDFVQHYGGNVNKVDMVSTGHRMLTLFGAPIAHEDDPIRAVQAALALPSTLTDIAREIEPLILEWIAARSAELQLLDWRSGMIQHRAGLASGTVFAGIVGGAQRQEYTVMGPTINLAARLLSVAKSNEVLLTSRVYRANKHRVEVQPLSPLAFKGFSQPIPVVRLLQQQRESLFASPAGATPLVGRATELAHLVEVAQQVLAPDGETGGIAVIVGEPGIGKSRLTDELLKILRDHSPSPVIVRGSCHSYEQSVPYALIARLLRRTLSMHAGLQQLQSLALQVYLDYLVPEWSRFAPLINPLLHLSLPETVVTHSLDAEQRFERLCDLLIAMFRAMSLQQPLVLVVDDLHWSDASSHTILSRLTNELAGVPLLLLLIYRSTMSLDEPWLKLPHCAIVWLHELTKADSQILLHALLEGKPPVELYPLLERMPGTPLFLEETMRYLLDSGVLQRSPGGVWECSQPVSQITVPGQIEQLIVARLDHLSEETRTLVQVAAVIGQEVSERVLAAICQACNMPLAHQSLAELISSAFLIGASEEPQGDYRFKHALLHDVVYNSLLFAHRRELHAMVARVIEQIYANELHNYRVTLAHHYLHAEQFEQAFPNFVLAGQQSQEHYAHAEALALYEQALAIAPWRSGHVDPALMEMAITLYDSLGDLLAVTSDYNRARAYYYQHLLDLITDASRMDHLLHRASLERKVGITYEQQGNYEQALLWLTHAQALLDSVSPEPARPKELNIEYARILSDMSWVNFRQNNLDLSQEYLEQALSLISLHNAYSEQARILNQLGGIAWHRGDLKTARYYVHQSLTVSEQNNDMVSQASTLSNLAILTEMQGNVEESIGYSVQAMDINKQLGRRREMSVNALNIGWAFYFSDSYEQAHTYFSQSVEYALAVHDDYHRMRALLGLGDVYAATAQCEQAQATLAQGLALAHTLQLPTEQLELYVALANVALQQGDLNRAMHYYQDAQPLASDTEPESEEYGQFQRLEARIAFAEGQTERAVRLLQENEELFLHLQDLPQAERTRKLLAEMISVRAVPSTNPS